LFAGVGGNRRLWGDDHEVVAVEWDVEVARAYSDFFPDDVVLVEDAHEFLRHHFLEFDFVWSSPPCVSHSRARSGFPVFPDFRLYEEVLLLRRWAGGGGPLWVVENVVPYYGVLFDGVVMGRHAWWSNFDLPVLDGGGVLLRDCNSVGCLEGVLGFDLSGYVFEDRRRVLRNCVFPGDGRLVLDRVEGLLGLV